MRAPLPITIERALEDKRWLSPLVPADWIPAYMTCETIVLDMRGMDWIDADVESTFADMEKLGIANPPYDCFVLLCIFEYPNEEKRIGTAAAYIHKDNFTVLLSAKYMESMSVEQMNKMSEASKLLKHWVQRLIVMLATKGIKRERHSPPKAMRGGETLKTSKRGYIGYTVIRPPSAQELGYQSSAGTHVSPRPHLRRGHIRHLKDRETWIPPCFVCGVPEEERKAYMVKT